MPHKEVNIFNFETISYNFLKKSIKMMDWMSQGKLILKSGLSRHFVDSINSVVSGNISLFAEKLF